MPGFLAEFFQWFVCDASENQIRISKAKKNNFRSYTQLKKHQKRLKLFGIVFILVVLSLFIGLLLGPDLFPKQIQSELYIPNGKGDILLANVSKNQATIIFKTLNSADNNKPLATKAFVEVFSDPNYSNMVMRSPEDDYAVTHIIPVDSLQEGLIYYIRITAKDASEPTHESTITSWGDGKDPIKFYTTGDSIPVCAQVSNSQIVTAEHNEDKTTQKTEIVMAPIAESSEGLKNSDGSTNPAQSSNAALKISEVLNENHLQPKNKVQTIISWNTNKPSTTVLVYGEGRSNEKKEILVSQDLKTKHAVVLTTLTAGKTYYFNAKSIDDDGIVVTSEEHSLRTPRPQSTIIDKISESFKSIFSPPKL